MHMHMHMMCIACDMYETTHVHVHVMCMCMSCACLRNVMNTVRVRCNPLHVRQLQCKVSVTTAVALLVFVIEQRTEVSGRSANL